MSKPRIRRLRDPWWHWPAAILWVLLQAAVLFGGLIGLAVWAGPRLNQWRDAHPGVFLAGLLAGVAVALLALLCTCVRGCVERWRERR